MSCSIKLVRLNDLAPDIDLLDLSIDGYSLATDGYFQVSAPIGAKSVRESITLKLQGSSKDDLAAMTQEIDEKVKQVQWWIDNPGIERYQVWLRVQLDNETYPRQAQILNIQPPDKVKTFTIMEMRDNYIGDYQIGIERTPFWEDVWPYPATTNMTDISTIGGTATLSETINGDVPARIPKLSTIVGLTAQLSSVWIGWKTSRFGTAANFIPVWTLADGAPVDADTSETADATTYAGGNKVTTSFTADATLILRDRVLVEHVDPINTADQRGSYLVLLRAKMSDASVARVKMVYGLYSGGAFQAPVFRSRAVISGTAWQLYELGNTRIPPTRLPLTYNFANFGIGLYAERLSGSGSLDMDCLILIPTDDSAVKLSSSGSLSAGQIADIFTSANEDLYATAQHLTLKSIFSVVPSPQGNWSLPANSEAPIIVIAASDSAVGNVKGKTVDISYFYIPRWRTLRGNST